MNPVMQFRNSFITQTLGLEVGIEHALVREESLHLV